MTGVVVNVATVVDIPSCLLSCLPGPPPGAIDASSRKVMGRIVGVTVRVWVVVPSGIVMTVALAAEVVVGMGSSRKVMSPVGGASVIVSVVVCPAASVTVMTVVISCWGAAFASECQYFS